MLVELGLASDPPDKEKDCADTRIGTALIKGVASTNVPNNEPSFGWKPASNVPVTPRLIP